jgi:hypothetical protein
VMTAFILGGLTFDKLRMTERGVLRGSLTMAVVL